MESDTTAIVVVKFCFSAGSLADLYLGVALETPRGPRILAGYVASLFIGKITTVDGKA